jgi:3-isopropylmalate dehydrogenase
MTIRKTFGCFANLRPIWLPPCLADRTPLKPELVSGGIDIMIIREFIFGLYYGERGRRKLANGEIEAFDTSVYTEKAVHQVAKLAFDIAARRRKKLTSMDKSNILETSRMWREIVTRMGKDYPQVELRHQLIDSGAMLLMAKPAQFDVIVVNNEFGDIISDEASVLAGSLGMIPSAALGDHPPYFFEPIHGSAPDIAGQGIANPIATILTAAMILEYSFDLPEAAAGVRRAVEKVLNDGYRTRDITAPGQKYISTTEMGDRIASIIS